MNLPDNSPHVLLRKAINVIALSGGLRTAEVRCLSFGDVVKKGNKIEMGNVSWDAGDAASNLADGNYHVAIRPHHILPTKTDSAFIAITGQVGVTELSGSESSAHFVFGDHAWVSLSHGVHPYQVGEDHTFYMNPSECLYFAPDGSRAA